MKEYKAIIIVNGGEFDYFTLEARDAIMAHYKAAARVEKAYPHLKGQYDLRVSFIG